MSTAAERLNALADSLLDLERGSIDRDDLLNIGSDARSLGRTSTTPAVQRAARRLAAVVYDLTATDPQRPPCINDTREDTTR